MNGFLYTLILEEPVLAGNLGGDPNSADSRFYIPGGAVRGAAIQAYAGNKDAADDDFRRLFLNGETRFLNAYPVLSDQRSLPIPLKYPKKKYLQVSDFGRIEANTLYALAEAEQINVHTQRDAMRGRSTTEAGAVYRYVALPAGMQLQGAILTDNSTDAQKLKELLDSRSILLGKARTAGYGHAKVKFSPLPEGWRETGQSLNVTQKVALTLLSPAIVRDENGQFSMDLAPALSARLGKKVTLGAVHRKAEIISGFNRIWGLPLPQVIAIAAGSVFEVESDATLDDWLTLESTGLGERRAEGFGRVAVNLELPDEVDWQKIEMALVTPDQGQLAKDDPIANRMLTRLLRRDLDEQIIHCARKSAELYVGGIPNSQLSRWRVIVRDVLETRDLDRLKKFADESKGKPGWKKMEKARITFGESRPRLTEWIVGLLEKPEMLDKAWEKDFRTERKLGAAGVTLTPDLNTEYRLRLLDAVLAVMSKKSGGKNGN